MFKGVLCFAWSLVKLLRHNMICPSVKLHPQESQEKMIGKQNELDRLQRQNIHLSEWFLFNHLRIFITGNKCRYWIWETEGSEGSHPSPGIRPVTDLWISMKSGAYPEWSLRFLIQSSWFKILNLYGFNDIEIRVILDTVCAGVPNIIGGAPGVSLYSVIIFRQIIWWWWLGYIMTDTVDINRNLW